MLFDFVMRMIAMVKGFAIGTLLMSLLFIFREIMLSGTRPTQRALDEVPECDCNSAFGFHEVSCAISIYRAALRQ